MRYPGKDLIGLPMSEEQPGTAEEAKTSGKTPDKAPSRGKHARLRQNKPLIAGLSVALAVLLALAAWGCFTLYQQHLDQKREEEERAAIQMPEPPTDVEYIAENPIDFSTLTAEHPDIYAWMTYPAVGINLPILQEAEQSAEDLYLHHDMNGEYSIYGELYTQKYNTKTFDDPVTVIYGHTFPDTDLMFTPLHLLEDEAFFTANPELYIYLPKKVLTYQIVSVAETDNTLILAANEFGNKEVLQTYYDSILHPSSDSAYVREDATLDAETDKIIQLSTCTIPSDPAHRFLVTAKLVSEQKTY